MNISDAVKLRKSVRAFTKDKVSNKLLHELLSNAARAPSGGNLQPWKIFILNNDSMVDFLAYQSSWIEPETPSYEIYPPKLKEPYRTSRYELGEQMYSLLGIERENKSARIEQVMKNFNFFGAPAALFCFIDRQMGPPQWSDLGMFLQTFMLLATEAGLDTCAQEAWSMKHESVSAFAKVDQTDLLFCGMAIGYGDKNAVINKLSSTRRPVEDWATFL
jgi:nitroreductase